MSGDQFTLGKPRNLLLFCVLLAGSVASSIGYINRNLSTTMAKNDLPHTDKTTRTEITQKTANDKKAKQKIVAMSAGTAAMLATTKRTSRR